MKKLIDPQIEPPMDTEDEDCSIEVPVVIDGEEYKGYVSEGYWWVHYGGITVGHRKTPCYELDGWYMPSIEHAPTDAEGCEDETQL